MLERYHSEGASTLAQLLELLDAGWRRSGFGEVGPEGELLEKARAALVRYHARLQAGASEPVWFERPFSFRLGPHHLRGRVDRVDRLADGGEGPEYELIDYKTSRPKSAEQLRDDIQLSLYALAASEDWGSTPPARPTTTCSTTSRCRYREMERDAEAVREVVMEVGEGILAQDFDPTPSPDGLLDLRLPHRVPGRRGLGRAAFASPLAQEALEFPRQMSPEGTSVGPALLLALGRLLEALHEGLDVRVALHRQAHLALVVGRSRLELRDVDRDPDQDFHPPQQGQGGLRVGGRGHVVGHGGP